MGMSPTQVDDLSFWQFQAAAQGFKRLHQTDEERAKELSKEDVDYISTLVGL